MAPRLHAVRRLVALVAVGVLAGCGGGVDGGDDATAPSAPATSESGSTTVDDVVTTADEPAPGPQAGVDHWHDAFLIHHCGTDLPPSIITDGPDGIHTHGVGLIHIHPFSARAAGPNATFGVFIEAIGGQLTDDRYTPGPGEDPTVLSEDEGCDGEPATLQLAYWSNAWTDDEPEIIVENLAEFRFDDPSGGAFTLALLPEGAEIPKPPLDRLDGLESVNGGRD